MAVNGVTTTHHWFVKNERLKSGYVFITLSNLLVHPKIFINKTASVIMVVFFRSLLNISLSFFKLEFCKKLLAEPSHFITEKL